MRRYISIMLAIIILLVPIYSYAYDKTEPKSIDESDRITPLELGDYVYRDSYWKEVELARTIKNNIISKHPNITYNTDEDIKVSEFIALLLKIAKVDIEQSEDTWYQGYIDTAKKYGLIYEGEFDSYDEYMPRAEAARILVRILGEKPESQHIENQWYADDENVPLELLGYVDSVVIEIICPYPYGVLEPPRFRPYSGISKAEALVILSKIDYKLLWNPFNLKPVKVKPVVEKLQDINNEKPPKLSNPPQRLYDIPVKPPTFFTTETNLTKMREDLYKAGMVFKRADKLLAKQSKKFAEIYYGFDYSKKEEYEDKLKYYYAGTYSDEEMGVSYYKDVDFVSSKVDYMTKNKVKGEARYYTSEDLVYMDDRSYVSRGTLQFIEYSNDNPPEGVELNKWYEQDIEILWSRPLLRPELGLHRHAEFTLSGIEKLSKPKELKAK